MSEKIEASAPRSGGVAKKIAIGGVLLIGLVLGGYAGALSYFTPAEASLSAWGTNLDEALATAKTTSQLVLVKAGSKW